MVLEKEEQPVEPYEPERLSHCSIIYTTHRRVNTDVTRRRLVPVLVCGNPEADARQDGEAVAGIAYCEFQHGNFLLSWFLVWRMKESTFMRNVCR
jgi:hypothetical protein